MSANLPSFDEPPVIETVLSAQFDQLSGFTSGHYGWFWKNFLEKSWSNVQQVERLEDQFERFGNDLKWSFGPGLKLMKRGESHDRIQFLSDDKEKMIQVQDSRFIYNWRKIENQYPRYECLLPEFLEHFAKFNLFVNEAGLGEINLNQWEVTYVNHLPKGELWQSLDDWKNIVPSFSFPGSTLQFLKPSYFKGSWSFDINEDMGRLHLSCSRAKLADESGEEIFSIQLTARGPIDEESGITLEKGFDIGHETIVNTFTEITSSEAHAHWKRKS